MIVCDLGGTLVAADGWLPSAPFDHRFTPSPAPIAGCNNLRCGDCGAMVRWHLGLVAREGFVPRFAYGSDDPPTDAVDVDPRARLYHCRCLARTEWGTTDLDSPQADEGRGFVSNWRCQGHPALEPGETVDGDLITTETIDEVVDRRLSTPTERLPDDLDFEQVGAPAFWLGRLDGLLSRSPAGSDVLDRLRSAVLRHASDPDDRRRYVVLNFVFVRPFEQGRSLVLEAAREAPDRFEGTVHIGRTTFDLARGLSAITGRSARSGQEDALALLKAQVLRGAGGRTGLLDVAELDHGWLLDHAPALLQANPHLLDTLVRQVAAAPAPRATGIIQQLVEAGASPEEIRAIVDRYLVGTEADAVLEALG